MFRVGFTAGRIEDADRPDWAGNAARPIRWSAWYPTDDADRGLLPASRSGPQLFVLESFVENAAFANGDARYPVVLLSHGTGGTAASLAWLARGLARRGFVVIGVDHHGNTGSELYRAEGFLCWWERARDLSVILDYHVDGPFAGHLDFDRMFASGFSLGGYTALCLLGGITQMPLFLDASQGKSWANGPREFPGLGEQVAGLLETSAVFRASWGRQSASYKDTRIKGAFLCAPAPAVLGMTVESLSKIILPVGIASVGADQEAPSDLCGEWLHGHLANSTFNLLHADAGHYSFLCECTDWGKTSEADLCVDPDGIDRSSIHRMAIELAISQFSA